MREFVVIAIRQHNNPSFCLGYFLTADIDSDMIKCVRLLNTHFLITYPDYFSGVEIYFLI